MITTEQIHKALEEAKKHNVEFKLIHLHPQHVQDLLVSYWCAGYLQGQLNKAVETAENLTRTTP